MMWVFSLAHIRLQSLVSNFLDSSLYVNKEIQTLFLVEMAFMLVHAVPGVLLVFVEKTSVMQE